MAVEEEKEKEVGPGESESKVFYTPSGNPPFIRLFSAHLPCPCDLSSAAMRGDRTTRTLPFFASQLPFLADDEHEPLRRL